MGAEVAGPGELELALRAGFKPETIVFDAPVKTIDEISRAIELGDAVMVHDTGAYCFSKHFMYNALNPDPVYSCRYDEAGQYQLTMINAGDSVAQLIANFS